MYVSRLLTVLALLLALSACKVVLKVPEGGSIVSASGENSCSEGACTIDVGAANGLSDTFTAIPNEGFFFVEWKKAQGYLCGGSAEACTLQVDEENSARDITVYLEPVFKSLDLERSPAPPRPPLDDASFAVDWSPSRVDNCAVDENVSPVLAATSAAAATFETSFRNVYEPSIVFLDETFTMMIKRDTEAISLTQEQAFPDFQPFRVVDGEDSVIFYDDGTHGDQVAGDGILTRSCVAVLESELGRGQLFGGVYDLFFLNPALRDTESATRISEAVRVNEAGMFISLGDHYSEAMGSGRHWEIFDPGLCVACQHAWHEYGDIFDFLSVLPRQAWAGQGYTRVHDFIQGTGHQPPFDGFSYWDRPMGDGRPHPEYIGMLYHGWPGSTEGVTHELAHGLVGINTKDFPRAGNGQWNAGDGAHPDADTTLQGDLLGPLWDPERGFPYPVRVDDGSPNPWEMPTARLGADANGNLRLVPITVEEQRFSEIFLYMMGLISAEESTERYFKVVNPALSAGCEPTEFDLICPPATTISADEVIEFSVADMVARYGPWGSANPEFDPSNLRLGLLFASDRNHTEAEITLHTLVFEGLPKPKSSPTLDENPWTFSTRGLSRLRTDFRNFRLPSTP
ncbi:MAG: hypothetical protein AAGC91_05925 [Pseudomonadota bacterium]